MEKTKSLTKKKKLIKAGELIPRRDQDLTNLTGAQRELIEREDEVFKKFYQPPKNEGAVILTDWSGSMGGDKEQVLKEAIKSVVPHFPNTKLVGFGGVVYEYEHTQVDEMTVDGGTPMGQALDLGWEMNKEQIILITDGQPTDSNTEDILREARKHKGTPINIIGIGSPFFNQDGRDDSIDEVFLRTLARITGGKYVRYSERDLRTMLPERVKVLLLKGG
jgi:Mg-chelatase subunit ChlD